MGLFSSFFGLIGRVLGAEAQGRGVPTGTVTVLDGIKAKVDERLTSLTPEARAEIAAILDEELGTIINDLLAGQLDKLLK